MRRAAGRGAALVKRVGGRGRTLVHSATQLRDAMGLSADQFDRARAAGLIAPDRAAGTYSGDLVDALAARAAAIIASLPNDLDAGQLRDALGMDYGAWHRAREAGLVPDPDRGAYWSRPAADQVIAAAEVIRARIPAQPLGAARCSRLLAELLPLPVEYEDILELAARGLLHVAGSFKARDLYDVDELTALAADEQGQGHIAEIVQERIAWLLDSLPPRAAARYLGWHPHELERVAAARGIAVGRLGRYALGELGALKTDEDLTEQVRLARQLGPRRAAAHLGWRPVDFAYAVDAGFIAPDAYVLVDVGERSRHEVSVPLYRVADLESIEQRAPAKIDWAELRAMPPGAPSPLRRYAARAQSRAAPSRARAEVVIR